METPPIVTPQEWKAAREQLLVREKEVTRARDALAAQRRRMPWLPVEKEYAFDGPKGSASLLDLFEDRRQLIIYRAFFEPGVVGWPDHACHGCSMMADQVADPVHLNARDITFAYASRAPQPDIARLKERMGWNWPWYTITSDWDVDFGVDEYHGTNAFIRDGDRVFRTYFVDNRGDEALGSTWSYLDLAALGRQETWEDSPEGYPQSPPYNWWNWHDEYDHPEMAQGPMKGWGMLRSDYRTASRPGAARGLHRGPAPPACPGRTRAPAMTQRLGQQARPLDGLRVLDLSRAVSGPLAGRILADLGADVVRAELPGTDVTQAFGKVTRGRSGLYSHVNAGKRSILLDLHQPGDVARLLDLAAACDVLVENFRPGVLDRFGAGWPALSAVNPRLVMLSISGFGRDGDDAGRAAYAPVIHAEAGLIGRQADITGDPPADIAFALADALAGLHGTIAILAALRLRDRTGTGQHIDLSMLEAMLATDDYTHYSIDEHPVRSARGEVWPAPGGPILISADRRYLWRQLKTCFGVADPDPDAPLEDKLRVRAGIMADWFAAHPDRDALKRDLESARLAWADIRHAGDVLAAPSVAGRDTVVEVTDGDGEKRPVARMPYRFSDAASGPVRGVPEPGEHSDAILRDWTTPADLPRPVSLLPLLRSHGS
jgi:crotonobetainyl-CoA:carnitine CoA-transferase CaiB-like acyl-CoA transferase/predicted dithiol-disulfide oxidoreductase (DUF899 family)